MLATPLSPASSGGLLRNDLPLLGREGLGPRRAALGRPQARKGLCMQVLPLGRLQDLARGFLDHAEGVLSEVSALAASACSCTHAPHAGTLSRVRVESRTCRAVYEAHS